MSALLSPGALAQTVDIETPELVVVTYTIAGLGSRIAAGLIDTVCTLLAMLAVVLLAVFALPGASGVVPGGNFAWMVGLFILVQFAVIWGYHVAFEVLADGRTPGKRLIGLRVVLDGGYSVTFTASMLRNILRAVDMLPPVSYLVGMIAVGLSSRGKRLGDHAAGTIVVREALGTIVPPAPPAAAEAGEERTDRPLRTVLTDDAYALVERWVGRDATLAPAHRGSVAAQVWARVAPAAADRMHDGDPATALRALYAEERALRQRGTSAQGASGAQRERHAIVATRSPRWIAFAATLVRVRRSGLGVLGEDGVRAFVAEYRALSGDLARLQTASAGAPSDELFYLGRLVASAHNTLYGRKHGDIRAVGRYLAIEVPMEIRRSVVPILLSATLLFGPAALAWMAVQRDASAAATLVSPAMRDRAADGVRRAARGDGYIDDPEILRPVMASRIVANNIQVSFFALAGGVTAGLGTAALLFLNGTTLGAFFGLYASYGILPLLLAFVAPHGVLELTAIAIAGGAGFLVAAAILLPGPRTRRRALAENGRRAVRLITGVTLLLLVAGAIEGLVSPIPWWPLELKLVVSALTAVLLWVYLRLGIAAGLRPRRAP